jgi:ATP-dependent protease HslVU (ClpYQ) ATPase subunit
MDELLFDLPDGKTTKVVLDRDGVRAKLADVVKDEDLRKYIL